VHADRLAPSDMPLVSSLLGNASSGRVSFHMPGHSDGSGFPAWFAEALARMDTTELPETDDLNHPMGPAKRAMDLAADAFGAGWTRFVTCGATCGVLAMFAATCPRGSRVLVQRTCHRSVVAAFALLGLVPVFLPVESDDATDDGTLAAPLPPASPARVAEALARDADLVAVIVTSPDYYGTVSDLAAIAAAAHARGALLLVDEAHGAHFAFSSDFPRTALSSGADVVVHSAHKTLPALTQAALLHVSRDALATGRVDPDRVAEALRAFQTSSPSFPIAASIDYARAVLQAEADRLLPRRLHAFQVLAHRLRGIEGHPYGPAVDGFSRGSRLLHDARFVGAGRDPLRIVLDVRGSGLTGFEAARRLAAHDVSVEMADPARIVLIPALLVEETGDDRGNPGYADVRALERALRAILTEGPATSAPWPLPDATFGRLLSTPAERVLPPDAGFAPRPGESVPLAQAVGRTLAGSLVPYPPGIPLVWPGERLDAARAGLVLALVAAGGTVDGLADGAVRCMAED
jgi:arginine/lysine/ornithine decarboxylase